MQSKRAAELANAACDAGGAQAQPMLLSAALRQASSCQLWTFGDGTLLFPALWSGVSSSAAKEKKIVCGLYHVFPSGLVEIFTEKRN